MASILSTLTSALPLLLFLGVVYAVIRISGLLSSTSAQTKSDLQKRGVTMVDGKVRVKTDIAAPSRDQYIASTQRAFERGAKTISDHADAFKVSHGSGEGVSSALPTPEKKGFQRGKKLA